MKQLNTILKNKDILCRFRLIQLWAVDVFTKSLSQNEPTLSTYINDTMLNNEDDDSTSKPEHILNTLFELKREYEEYNMKLEKVDKIIQLQNKYVRILHQFDDTIPLDTNTDIATRIAQNQRIIDGINKLNVNNIENT